MSDKPDVVAIHSMHVRGAGKEDVDPETGIIEGGDTDHMLVIGDEVILIDSKRWKKGGYSIDDSGKVLRFKKSFAGGSRMHMKQAMHIWLDYLDSSARISGIVCINCEEAYVVRDRIGTHAFIVSWNRIRWWSFWMTSIPVLDTITSIPLSFPKLSCVVSRPMIRVPESFRLKFSIACQEVSHDSHQAP